jgi:hypothetical protein
VGLEGPFVEPEAACGISKGVVKKAVKDWTIRDHRKHCNSVSGFRQAKPLIKGLYQ